MNPPRAVDPLNILRRFAPGTPLRTAAELIVRQGTGALILLASGDRVESVLSGGFVLSEARFTSQRLAELAKMDAGIVVTEDVSMILRANVHFIPDSSIPTSETGTRCGHCGLRCCWCCPHWATPWPSVSCEPPGRTTRRNKSWPTVPSRR